MKTEPLVEEDYNTRKGKLIVITGGTDVWKSREILATKASHASVP